VSDQKLILPRTEYFYQKAMRRSTEIKVQAAKRLADDAKEALGGLRLEVHTGACA
jgi:hypothetical protein